VPSLSPAVHISAVIGLGPATADLGRCRLFNASASAQRIWAGWSRQFLSTAGSHEVRRPVVYPGVAEKLADLAARIATNDAVIERINSKLPKDATWIAGAELVARKLRSFFDGTADIQSRGTCGCRRSGMPRSTRTRGRQPENSTPRAPHPDGLAGPVSVCGTAVNGLTHRPCRVML
jgi:hypothetical protein